MGIAPQEMYCECSTIKLIKAVIMRFLLAAALIVASSIIGCTPLIREGWVIRKHIEPAHEKLEFNPVLEMLQHVHVPKKWTITIKKNIDGKTVTRTVNVSEEEYRRYDVGDWADF